MTAKKLDIYMVPLENLTDEMIERIVDELQGKSKGLDAGRKEKALPHKIKRRKMVNGPKPPFRVDIVDQFNGHCEDGYGVVGTYRQLEKAIAEAKRITDEAISEAHSFEKWYGFGDAGLVYDSTGMLVWSGVVEAEKQHRKSGKGPVK